MNDPHDLYPLVQELDDVDRLFSYLDWCVDRACTTCRPNITVHGAVQRITDHVANTTQQATEDM